MKKSLKTKSCSHQWRTLSYSSKKEVAFLCSKCQQTHHRSMTKSEQAIVKRRKILKSHTKIHRVWHSFAKEFMEDYFKFKYQGYDMMKRVAKWARTQPKGFVHIVYCDDSYHASSNLVLIEHKRSDKYMGTSVVLSHNVAVRLLYNFFFIPVIVLFLLQPLPRFSEKPLR
mgnify:CR=1 FL=1